MFAERVQSLLKGFRASRPESRAALMPNRVLILAARPGGVLKSRALKSSRMKAKDFDKVLESMITDGLIEISVRESSTKAGILITATGKNT